MIVVVEHPFLDAATSLLFPSPSLLNRLMWKPGTQRPKKGSKGGRSAAEKEESSLNNSPLASNKSPPSVKKLSTGTMNMRFMQRTSSVSPKQLQHQKQQPVRGRMSAPAAMQVDHHVDRPRDDDDDASATAPFVAATAQDMYGTVLMGRRSLGGFRPVVQHMHQESVQSVEDAAGGAKRKRKRNKK